MKARTTILSLSLLLAAPAFAASSAAEVRDSRPEAATTWWEMAPMETRSGLLRFVGDAALDADALPILVERLQQKDESTSVRMALAEALRRTGAEDWAQSATQLSLVETDDDVHIVLIETLRRSEMDIAEPALRAGVLSENELVRAATIRTIGGHNDGDRLGELVIQALDDADPGTRSDATRAAGWLHLEAAWSSLELRLADEQPEVRLRAIRALERIDPVRAGTLEGVRDLVNDTDTKVARAALQLQP